MSADNYIYVRKRDDGRFGVSMRCASCYYADEGHTVESLQRDHDACEPGKWDVDDDWIASPPDDHYGIFDTPEDAVMAAHKAHRDEYVVEYGVCVGPGVAA